MQKMIETLSAPWPWYVVGALIGLTVPVLLLLGNKQFGVSSNLRHICAATLPSRAEYFRYNWRKEGAWNLWFLAGLMLGGWIGGHLLASSRPLVPAEIFNWRFAFTPRGLILLAGGGFLVGFGTAYAGGCTSGHAISGLADRQLSSLVAVLAFFAGGLLATHLLLPMVLR